jgi:cytochrome o ubiquinol oxidase subunit 2
VAEVKASGNSLDLSKMLELVKPSEKVPVMRFAPVQEGLFDRAVNRCIEPGKPCMIDIMRQDMQAGGDNPHDSHMGHGMPSGREAEPLTGERAKPALQKAPQEKGTSPNVTKPVQPESPGQLKPGDPKNRDQSATDPLPAICAPRSPRA